MLEEPGQICNFSAVRDTMYKYSKKAEEKFFAQPAVTRNTAWFIWRTRRVECAPPVEPCSPDWKELQLTNLHLALPPLLHLQTQPPHWALGPDQILPIRWSTAAQYPLPTRWRQHQVHGHLLQ